MQNLNRVFKMGSVRLADPDPTASPEAVCDLYAVNYPHLAHANVEGPETVGDDLEYTFVPPPAKTKG